MFLIPVYTDNTYKASKEYFIKNLIPIQSEEQIPAGQQACTFAVFKCSNCGARQVIITDFLKVREQAVNQDQFIYTYKGFEDKVLSCPSQS